jgi:hypothetical protein
MATQRRALVFHINGSDFDLHLFHTERGPSGVCQSELRIVTFIFYISEINFFISLSILGHIYLFAGHIERIVREDKSVHKFDYKT